MKPPVVISSNAISRFLNHVQSAGKPTKVTNPYLKSVGFKSSNDSALVPMLRSLGFIDGSGVPTDLWQQYKNTTKSRAILGQAIKNCYRELFDVYPDANRKDDEALTNFFREKTGWGDLQVSRAVKTFKALCQGATFDAVSEELATAGPAVATEGIKVSGAQTASASGFPISVNIELQLPATDDPKIYDNLFKAMKEHLLS